MDDILAKLRANGASGTAALEMAQKLIGNVIAKQDEPKYRKIKTSNAKLQAALFSVPGGRELMLACGFEEDSGGEELILPSSASLVTLRLRLLAGQNGATLLAHLARSTCARSRSICANTLGEKNVDLAVSAYMR